jgi:outer membrane protein, heavy metal efflux system
MAALADGTNAPGAARVVSLSEARSEAFARNWDLLAAKSGVSLAEAQLIAAKELPNPTVSLTSSKIGTHESSTILGNSVWHRSYDTIASVSQLIEIGGKRSARQTAARAGILGARARFFDAKRTLDQGVTKAFVAVALSLENVRLLKETAGYMRRQATIAKAQANAGDISAADLKTLEINAEQLELQARAAETAAVQARISVEVLMGVEHPTGAWAPAESLEKLAEIAPRMVSGAADRRADVVAAAADLEASRAQVRLQKALRIPDPTVFVGVEHNPPGGGPATDTVNIGVSFPLPVFSLNKGGIQGAKAASAQLEAALAKARAQAAADNASAESAYSEARARAERYRSQTVPKSAEVRELVRYKYEKGAATLVDFLNAQQTDNNIRLAAAQAAADAASASADLVAARSVVSDEEIRRLK